MPHFLVKILLIEFIVFSFNADFYSQSNKKSENIFSNNRPSLHQLNFASEIRPLFNPVNDSINSGLIDSTQIIKKNDLPINNVSVLRLSMVSGASLAILGGIYYRWKTAWWTDPSATFHVQYNYSYTANVDKIGHLYGGILFTECFAEGLKWSGLDDESALLFGAFFSTLVYTGVEIKDGYAPTWGFDPIDLAGSAVGAFYPYIQQKVPILQNFNFKYSYFPSNSPYFNKHKDNQFFNDDYEGETFWLAADLKNLLPSDINSFMPDFLNLAVGVSVENLDNPSDIHRVFLLSPDIDLVKLFKPENEIMKECLRLLNYIHIPLPAISVSPDFKAYPLYLRP